MAETFTKVPGAKMLNAVLNFVLQQLIGCTPFI